MSDVQQGFDALRREVQQKASEYGYSDPQKFLQENGHHPDVRALERKAEDLQKKSLKAEQDKLYEAAPELRNSETQKAFASWLQSERGYSQQEIASITDNRLMADLWRSYKASGPRPTVPRRSGQSERSSTGSITRDIQRAHGEDVLTTLYGD